MSIFAIAHIIEEILAHFHAVSNENWSPKKMFVTLLFIELADVDFQLHNNLELCKIMHRLLSNAFPLSPPVFSRPFSSLVHTLFSFILSLFSLFFNSFFFYSLPAYFHTRIFSKAACSFIIPKDSLFLNLFSIIKRAFVDSSIYESLHSKIFDAIHFRFYLPFFGWVRIREWKGMTISIRSARFFTYFSCC